MRTARCVMFLSLLPACAQPGAQSAAESAGVGATAAVDLAADEHAVRDATQRWASALRAGDSTAIHALYSDDAVWLRPGSRPILNRDSLYLGFAPGGDIRRRGSPPGTAPDSGRLGDQTQETMRVVVSRSGDLAYELGRFSTPGPGAVGLYVRVWQKQNGQWRLLATAPRVYAPDSAAGGALRGR